MAEFELGISISQQLETIQAPRMSPIQRQMHQFQQDLREWRDDPYSRLSETEVAHSISLSARGGRFNVGGFWKDHVRPQLLNAPLGEAVTVAVTSTGSGAGKGSINRGLLHFAKHDLYLHHEAVNEGFFVVPVVLPFAMYMVAAGIPKTQGGPGAIEPGISHGKFSHEQYRTGSEFGQWLYDEHYKNRRRDVRFLYLIEGSGVPWIKKMGDKVEVEGMPDRGASTVYNPSDKGKKFVLLVDRNEYVGAQSVNIRSEYDPETPDLSHIFNGRDRYLLTNKFGKVRDVAKLSAPVQRNVVELQGLASAPPKAIERSDGEFSEMKGHLLDAGIIPGFTNESYLRVVRQKLLQGGYADDEVLIVDNPWRSATQSNDQDMDYLLRYNLVAQLFKKRIVPRYLRGTYMDFPPDYIYLGGRRGSISL